MPRKKEKLGPFLNEPNEWTGTLGRMILEFCLKNKLFHVGLNDTVTCHATAAKRLDKYIEQLCDEHLLAVLISQRVGQILLHKLNHGDRVFYDGNKRMSVVPPNEQALKLAQEWANARLGMPPKDGSSSSAADMSPEARRQQKEREVTEKLRRKLGVVDGGNIEIDDDES